MRLRPFALLLLVATLSAALILPAALHPLAPWGVAWADDDDDDDDDDNDAPSGARGRDDDSGGGPGPRAGSGGNFLRNLFGQPRQVRRSTPAPPPPAFVADEIVALSLTVEDLAALTAQGFSVIEELAVPGLSATPRRLRVPPGIALADARAAVRALTSGQDADLNHYYRAEAGFATDCRGADCPARQTIGWPRLPVREGTCGASVPIGMIDTGINEAHETFDGARIELHRLSPEGFDPSRAVHGTAVAALLVGDPATRAPGLVPGARLVAVDAFHRAGADERADVFTLVEALGFLAGQGVRVINLSLAGPDNGVLSEAIGQLVGTHDIVVVSAAGNGGPNAQPAYPAAYEPVIAVTAVDRAGRVYRRAVQGAHIDLAAPGVDVWTAASVRGARWKTGTSFAVPFVSAAAAILREARPDLTAAEVGDELRRRARDLGPLGHDAVFGAGLLNLGTLCGDKT
ncbi:S8 family serine peptidase [Rhodovulum euryhalinum]|uniref:Subtilase family protein n=1 Tax=Rhodovulum euryhalinum TaxID=35805 RepID=A0A4R2KJ96_9RHOB|nr:S8 family serine peptidase [Rhodovulum euryhalinum]TCO73324.1 subtilase family protein [Rhodovulum euryhalinum]